MTNIHQHIKWSSDIDAAPKGETVMNKRSVVIKGNSVLQEIPTFVPTFIMALTKCGKVVRTYWIPGNGKPLEARWSGLNHDEQPLLWAHWPDALELMAALSVAPKLEDAARIISKSKEDAA